MSTKIFTDELRSLVASAIDGELDPALGHPERAEEAVVGRERLCRRLADAALRAAAPGILEAAARVAEERHRHWRETDDTLVSCDVTACADIAAAIRRLTQEGGGPTTREELVVFLLSTIWRSNESVSAASALKARLRADGEEIERLRAVLDQIRTKVSADSWDDADECRRADLVSEVWLLAESSISADT